MSGLQLWLDDCCPPNLGRCNISGFLAIAVGTDRRYCVPLGFAAVTVVVPKPTVRRDADDELEATVVVTGVGLCIRFSFDLSAKLLMFDKN